MNLGREVLIYGEHLWCQTLLAAVHSGGSCDTVTPVALQREREVPGHCETEALVFKQINTIGWAKEKYLHRVICFIERQPSVCTECTWE